MAERALEKMHFILVKPTQFVVMSLLLFTTALLIGAVSNESVNKDKSTIAPSPPIAAPAHGGIIVDHSDLPTRFGDEDDVIEGKAAAEKKESAANAAASGVINGKSDANGKKHDPYFDSNEEHYEDEDDDFLGEHNPNKNSGNSGGNGGSNGGGAGNKHHDVDESESDYDDDSDLGPTLDNFGAKLDGTDTGNELPIFLVEPQSAYVVRNRAAILKCKAAHALQVCCCCYIYPLYECHLYVKFSVRLCVCMSFSLFVCCCISISAPKPIATHKQFECDAYSPGE